MTDEGTIGKYTRVVGAQREEVSRQVASAYEQGHSVRRIGEDIGRSYGFVHRLLRESGVTLRGHGFNGWSSS